MALPASFDERSVTTRRRRRRVRWALVALLAPLAMAAGAVALWRGGGDTGSAEDKAPTAIPADARVQLVADLAGPEAQVFAMQFAANGDLWYVASAADGAVSLRRLSSSGEEAAWPLPGRAASTPNTYLAPGPGGSWWVAANYNLWRFDPGSESAVVAVVLEREHPLATAAAADQSAPLPGTWINGLVSSGGSAWVSRANVRALFALAPDGATTVEREMASAPQGIALVGGQPLPYSSVAEVARTGTGGRVTAGEGGAWAQAGGCAVVTDPASDRVTVEQAGKPRELAGLGVRPYDVAGVSSSGGRFAVGLGSAAVLLRGECGGAFDKVQLPVSFINFSDPSMRVPQIAGGAALPQGYARSTNRVLALAVAEDGRVAFSDSKMRVFMVRP